VRRTRLPKLPRLFSTKGEVNASGFIMKKESTFETEAIAEKNALFMLHKTLEDMLPIELVRATMPLTEDSTGFVKSQNLCNEFWQTVFNELKASGKLYRFIRDILQRNASPFG
jgi:hypothetical protein